MEEYCKMKWFKPPPIHKQAVQSNIDYYKFDFFANERDTLLCHLFEIDQTHINLYSDSNADTQFSNNSESRTCLNSNTNLYKYHDGKIILTDPRTNCFVYDFLLDWSTAGKRLKLFAGFPKRSKLKSTEHTSCINALKRLRSSQSLCPLTELDKKDLEIFMASTTIRKQEREAFLSFVKEYFFANLTKRWQLINVPVREYFVDRWRRSLERIHNLKDDSHYCLQTALPLDYSTIPQRTTFEFRECDTIKMDGFVPTYSVVEYRPGLRKSIDFFRDFYKSRIECESMENEQLFLKYGVNFSISLSSMAILLCSPENHGTDWMMTAEVKEINDNKFVYIKKPLPKIIYKEKEQTSKAMKYYVKASLCFPNKKTSYSLNTNSTIFDIECFNDKPENLPAIYNRPEYKLEPIDNYYNRHENQHSKSIVDRNNVTYRIWSLERLKILNQEKQKIKFLVRTKIDGCEKEDKMIEFINISTKVEYQSEFGAEQISKHQLIKEWLQLLFQPNTVIDRVRIDVSTGIIISNKRLYKADIEMDLQRLYETSSQLLLQKLWDICQFVTNFPPNEYLLRHGFQHGSRVMIYQKCENKVPNSISLKSFYNNIDTLSVSKSTDPNEWTPIDDMEMTMVHLQSGVPPCCFPAVKSCKVSNKVKERFELQNDRLHVIKKAQHKISEKDNKRNFIKLNRQSSKALKKKRKRQKHRIAKAYAELTEGHTRKKIQRTNMDDVETIDPNHLFDADGNVTMDGLRCINPVKEGSQISKSFSMREVVNYSDYIRDAEISEQSSLKSLSIDDQYQECKTLRNTADMEQHVEQHLKDPNTYNHEKNRYTGVPHNKMNIQICTESENAEKQHSSFSGISNFKTFDNACSVLSSKSTEQISLNLDKKELVIKTPIKNIRISNQKSPQTTRCGRTVKLPKKFV